MTKHIWLSAPHYADIYYARGEKRVYWWCGRCEEHRFQKTKPRGGKCPFTVTIKEVKDG